MYAQDSFHTLTTAAQVGLVVLSAALSGAVLLLAYWLMRRRRFIVRIGIALVTFYLFVWLSPQLYYAYYLVVFDGLPLQSVIKAPPTPNHIVELLMFSERATLSDHGKGLLGWGLLCISMIQVRRQGCFSGSSFIT